MAKKFDNRDFALIADYIYEEWKRRKTLRGDFDLQIADIDRQIKMKPSVTHKLDATGAIDRNRAWMPEIEPELQSQTLEVLTADARRMIFPDSGPWFRAHSATTDAYMQSLDLASLIAGDENDIPSRITQDNVDQLVAGSINHWNQHNNLYKHVDLINSEAFKYSIGIGRVRRVKKKVIVDAAGFEEQSQMIPVLVPRSLKRTYLDDRQHALMMEGFDIGAGVIFETTINLDDLKGAANIGSNDPEREDGGWMPKNLANVTGNKANEVMLLEWEGDLVVPRKTVDSIVIERPIVTICCGKSGPAKVIRFRFSTLPFSSYIPFEYQPEDVETPYGSSPLLKGRGLQTAASDALLRFLMVAAIKAEPPLNYSSDDAFFKSTGGPRFYPGVLWSSTDGVKPFDIGDPTAMFQAYMGLRQAYYGVTGVNQPRLGAQTVSHTTAYAKQAELARGEIRTVDYVKATLSGPMNRWLQACYLLGRDSLKKTVIYIEAYNGFVTLSKGDLPDHVVFDVHGAGGPQEKQAKDQAKLTSLQVATNLDQLNAQYKKLGFQPTVDLEKAIYEVLGLGGWTDIDALLAKGIAPGAASPLAGLAGQPAVPQAPVTTSTAPAAALQTAAELVGHG